MHKSLPAGLAAALLLCSLPFLACSNQGNPPSALILISFDGFRWDYLDHAETPNFDRLTSHGIRARGLIPVFPTKTFPNHYSIVTGLYPANHGVVANVFYDPEYDEHFRAGTREAAQEERWWGGEPLWVSAERQGLKTAPKFWPGNEAPVQGVRPSYSMPYQHGMPNPERVEQVLEWLDLPVAQRPSFITLYFSMVDSAGHAYGPDSPQVTEKVVEADQLLGQLWEGLEQRSLLQSVNILIVSDHGMVATSPLRAVALDDYVDLEKANVVHWAPATGLWPSEENLQEVAAAAAQVPHTRLLSGQELKEHFNYAGHRRIPPLLLLAEEGWSIATSQFIKENPERLQGGSHGYDHRLQSMQGIFLAHGPAFKQGYVVEAFENVHIHPLMGHLLGIETPPSDGRLEAVAHLLRQAP